MNIFQYLQKVESDNKIIRWVRDNLVLNSLTKEFHFTEAQRGVLIDHQDNERYYKMNRQSGKTTLLKCECLYHAFKNPYSVHIVFSMSRTQASRLCNDYADTLTESGLATKIIQRNSFKITLENRSEIYFVTPIGFEQQSCSINIRDKKRFVYCDDINEIVPRLSYARTIQARFLAFSTLQQERVDSYGD